MEDQEKRDELDFVQDFAKQINSGKVEVKSLKEYFGGLKEFYRANAVACMNNGNEGMSSLNVVKCGVMDNLQNRILQDLETRAKKIEYELNPSDNPKD